MLRRALALAFLLIPAAHAEDLKLVTPGKLTWGSTPTFAPYEFIKDGKPQGFDVDMMDALAKRAGLQAEMQALDFAGLIPSLLGGRLDATASGMYITPARLEIADFIPYMLIGNQLVTAKGNPKHVDSPSSLCGLKVGVATSTAFEATLKKTSESCVAAGKPAIDILSVPGSNLVALAITQGRVDAGLTSTATASVMISENPDTYEMAGPPFDATTKLGIALRKDSGPLKTALEASLRAMVKDGSFAALMKKWNLPASVSIF